MLEVRETKQQTKCHCAGVAVQGKMVMSHFYEAVFVFFLTTGKTHGNMGMNKILNTSEDFRGAFFLIALFVGDCLMIPTRDGRRVTDQLGKLPFRLKKRAPHFPPFMIFKQTNKQTFRQFNVGLNLYQGGRLNMVAIKLSLSN